MTSQLENQLVTQPEAQSDRSISVFSSMESFANAQRMAQALADADMVPKEYQKNVSNCLIALEVSGRTQSSVLMVMQNLYVVHGKPGWSSQYIIAALNSCGKFAALKFKLSKKKGKEETVEYTDYVWNDQQRRKVATTKTIKVKNQTCVAYTTERATGDLIEGPEVSIVMAVQEGWYTKDGSKWRTMQELMLRYRAAAFFGRLYAPEIMMGMQTAEELNDIKDITEDAQVIDSASLEDALVGDLQEEEPVKKEKAKPAPRKKQAKAKPVEKEVAAEVTEEPEKEDTQEEQSTEESPEYTKTEALAAIENAESVDDINDVLSMLGPLDGKDRPEVLRAAQKKIGEINN